jgi:two-component system, LytTR family, response regulator
MIRAMIVDDEIAAVGNLSDLLNESGIVEAVEEFTNPLEAVEKVKNLHIDIAFLDIEMPGMDGITLANRILDMTSQTEVVFVTAYNEYAVEAFELNAMDYLVKPITRERLNKTLQRVADQKKPVIHKSKLKVYCFGKCRVENESGTPIKWRTSKTEELFAYLVDRDGKEVGREKLIEAIWGKFEEKRALTNFSTCLYNMRKALGELGWPELLISAQGMYKLDMDQICSDIQQFERCFSLMNDINEENSKDFEEIIENCGEGYLELNYYEWAENKRRLLEDAYLQFIVQMAIYYRTKGREQKAVDVLKRGLMKDSLDPGLNQALLTSYLQMKDRVAAMKHFDSYKRKLAKEYGVKPDEEMERLLKSFK